MFKYHCCLTCKVSNLYFFLNNVGFITYAYFTPKTTHVGEYFQISNHILTTTIQSSTSLPSTCHRLPSQTDWRENRRKEHLVGALTNGSICLSKSNGH